jgi:hypothetical protein
VIHFGELLLVLALPRLPLRQVVNKDPDVREVQLDLGDVVLFAGQVGDLDVGKGDSNVR